MTFPQAQVRNSEGPELPRHLLCLQEILGPGEAAFVEFYNSLGIYTYRRITCSVGLCTAEEHACGPKKGFGGISPGQHSLNKKPEA